MKTTPENVLRSFYVAREAHTGKRPPGFIRPKAITHAAAFISWCAKVGIDEPLRFLRWRMDAAKHSGWEPQIHQLRSNKLAENFLEWGEGRQRQSDRGDEIRRAAGSLWEQQVKELRILTRGMEAFRQPYVLSGTSEICMRSDQHSGGFHPKSRWCPVCPSAVRCADALNTRWGFDVVALRAGRLKDVPKSVAAAAVK